MGTPRNTRRTLTLAVSAIALLATTSASAAPLVLYRSLPSRDPIGSVKQQMQARLGFGDSQLTRVIPLARYAFDGALLWPLDEGAQFCESPRHPELEAAITDAETALDLLDFPRAAAVLEPLFESLACVGRGATADRLARAALLMGYARFQLGDRDGAATAFGQAASFDPDIEWDGTYPPDAQQVFNNAVLDSLRQPASTLGGTLDGVLVDGRPVGDDHTLRPGWHLLAVPREEGDPVRLAVELTPGRRLDLGDTQRMVDEFFEGGRGFAATLAVLRAHVSGEGDPETYLVDSERSRILRFFGGSGELRELPGGGGVVDTGDRTGNGDSRGDDDDADDDDDDDRNGGGRSVGATSGLRRPVKIGLGIGGGALLLGGMGIAVGTGVTYRNVCYFSQGGEQGGNIHLQGLVPVAGPGMLHSYWSQNWGQDCYENLLPYYPPGHRADRRGDRRHRPARGGPGLPAGRLGRRPGRTPPLPTPAPPLPEPRRRVVHADRPILIPTWHGGCFEYPRVSRCPRTETPPRR